MNKKGLQILFIYDFIIGAILIILSFIVLLALLNANTTASQEKIDTPRDSYFQMQQLRTFVMTPLTFQGEIQPVYYWLEYYVKITFLKQKLYDEISLTNLKGFYESEYAYLVKTQIDLETELKNLAKIAFEHDSLKLQSRVFLAKEGVIDLDFFKPLDLSTTTKSNNKKQKLQPPVVFLQVPIFLDTISEHPNTYSLYISLGTQTSDIIATQKTPVELLFNRDVIGFSTDYSFRGGVVL
jgi:hypothetical protein